MSVNLNLASSLNENLRYFWHLDILIGLLVAEISEWADNQWTQLYQAIVMKILMQKCVKTNRILQKYQASCHSKPVKELSQSKIHRIVKIITD